MKIYNDDRFDRLPDAILFDTDNTLYPMTRPILQPRRLSARRSSLPSPSSPTYLTKRSPKHEMK